ncbi:unnamed protein product [Prunus armeniaca]|uniref:Uncharacterized protein n=1 Tax=Prunus armeniaca TaxID=36596 RepID=A0A6J5X842_PRUAR|nr:unnamed protein product [Prunus armeniaca]
MRVNRISQFVADLQSPKRGGSLVVQTGFPTSLVDLFVKNRDHLKKPSKKNKNRKKNNRSADQVNDRITANCELGSGNFGILVQPSSPKVKNLSREEGDRGVEAAMRRWEFESGFAGGVEDVRGGGFGFEYQEARCWGHIVCFSASVS